MTDLELAREWLRTYLDMLEGLSPTKLNRDIHYNRLAALLAHVRLSEHKVTCGRCGIRDSETFNEALMHESLQCERRTALEQAAGGSAAAGGEK